MHQFLMYSSTGTIVRLETYLFFFVFKIFDTYVQDQVPKLSKTIMSQTRGIKRKMDKIFTHSRNERGKLMRIITGEDSSATVTPTHYPDTPDSTEEMLDTFSAKNYLMDKSTPVNRALELWWRGSPVERIPPLHMVRMTDFPDSEQNK